VLPACPTLAPRHPAPRPLQPLSRLRGLRTLLVGGLTLVGPRAAAYAAAAARDARDAAAAGPAAPAPAPAAQPPAPPPPPSSVPNRWPHPVTSVERLVVSGCSRLQVDPSLGLLAAFPALAALGVVEHALAAPLQLLPAAAAAAPPPPPPARVPRADVPGSLLQELRAHQAAAGPHAVAVAAAPPADAWAASPSPHSPAAPAAGPDDAAAAAADVPLRELCVVFDGMHDDAEPNAAGLSPVEQLLAAAVALQGLQRLRLWQLRNPQHGLRVLTRVTRVSPRVSSHAAGQRPWLGSVACLGVQ
jgi:hypothetical protein